MNIRTHQDAKKMSGEVVYEPHDHDVKIGSRGNGNNRHAGNRFYREKVKEMKILCSIKETNFEKSLVASSEVVRSVQERNPPGRFLEQMRIGMDESWTILSQDRIRMHVKQALRDKPQVRRRYDCHYMVLLTLRSNSF